jgi:hypothetical protein
MPRPPETSPSYVAGVSLLGQSSGVVKRLAGFRKPHHTVPDAVNAVTTAFLGKLCATELVAEGEEYYQRAKTALGYKRADLSLDVTSPTAVLTTKDFTLEIAYALETADPAAYRVTRALHSVRNGGLLQRGEFDQLFAGTFSAIVFTLAKGVKVEAVIDAVEARPAGDPLTVRYPSDCRHCVLTVEGVAAEVGCDGAALEMRFPRAGSPREMIEAFLTVRSAFALTKDAVLAGLL